MVIAPANRAKIEGWINEAPEFRRVETEPLANDAFEIRAIVTLLQSVPTLSDRHEWLHALPRAVARLTSDESGSDTRAAAALIRGTTWP